MASITLNKLRQFFVQRPFWQDRLILVFFSLNVLSLGGLWPLWLLKIAQSGYPIYAPFVIQFLGDQFQIYFLPGIGSAIFVLNLILALYSYKQEKLASYFLLGSAIFAQILIWVFFFFFLKYSLSGF